MTMKLTHLLIFLCCFNGVVLKYNKDGVALAFCTAESIEPGKNYGRVLAVYRKCSKTGKKCKDICKGIDKTYNCFETINIYDKSAFGYAASFRYRLSGCETTNCGPNYCCCRKD